MALLSSINGGSASSRGKSRRTRMALREALLALIVEKPLEQITIRELTAAAGVAYATYFRNYADKEALLHDLVADEVATLLALTVPLFVTVDSLASTRALCAYVWERRDLWRALLTGGAAGAMKTEYQRQALLMREKQPLGESWLPADLAVSFCVAGLVEILTWWLKHEDPPSAHDMAEVINRLAVMPLMQPDE